MRTDLKEEVARTITTICTAYNISVPNPQFRENFTIIDSESFSFENNSVAWGFRRHEDNLPQ